MSIYTLLTKYNLAFCVMFMVYKVYSGTLFYEFSLPPGKKGTDEEEKTEFTL